MAVVILDGRGVTGDALVAILNHANYRVTRVATTAEALALPPEDIELLLMVLPTTPLPAAEFVTAFRLRTTQPIIVLYDPDDETGGVEALEIGADDFLCRDASWTDPDAIAARELLARMTSCLRLLARHAGDADDQPKALVLGGIVMDVDNRRVTVRGAPLKLTPREFALLRVLLEARGEVAPTARILDELWGDAGRDQTHYVYVYISRVRQALHDAGASVEINNRSGFGYELTLQHAHPPVEEAATQ